jgi:predicted nucleic acid-binding protein
LAHAIWNAADTVASARLIYPETRAALAAAQRAKRVPGRALPSVLLSLEERFADLELIELSGIVARAAGAAAERFALRANDAIHLASALAIPEEVTVSTWGADLRRASLAAGLSVSP